MSFDEDFIGPLAALPTTFAAGAEGVRALLEQSPLAGQCYVPATSDEFVLDLAVCFARFQWEPNSPRLWVMTTVGLSAAPQPKADPPTRAGPTRFELCAGFEFRPTPPSDRAVVGGQSWSESDLLSAFVENFALVAHDLASAQRSSGRPYALGTVFDDVGLANGWPDGVLVAPMNELRTLGVQPFSLVAGVPTPIGLGAKEWMSREKLEQPADVTFLQLAPISRDEAALARQWGGWNFFVGGLIPTPAEFDRGLDASAHVFDLGRGSRATIFEQWRKERMT